MTAVGTDIVTRLAQAAGDAEVLEQGLRSRLAELALTAQTDTLADLLNQVARASALSRLFDLAVHIATLPDGGPVEVAAFALSTLTAPADDTWSGRGNDARRSAADGTRDAATAILRIVGRLQ